MFYKPLIFPLLAQVALTFLVMLHMYVRRVREFQRRRIDPQAARTRSQASGLLKDSAPSSDHFQNLFEMPVLFYVAVLLALTLLVNDRLLLLLAWLFVALRAAHSLIHLTYNQVMHRFFVFIASAVVLLGIWVRLAAVLLLK